MQGYCIGTKESISGLKKNQARRSGGAGLCASAPTGAAASALMAMRHKPSDTAKWLHKMVLAFTSMLGHDRHDLMRLSPRRREPC